MTLNMTDDQLARLIDQLRGEQILPVLRASIALEHAHTLQNLARQAATLHSPGLYRAADILLGLAQEVDPPENREPAPDLDAVIGPVRSRPEPRTADGYRDAPHVYEVANASVLDLAGSIMYAVRANDRRMLEVNGYRISVDARDLETLVVEQLEIPGTDKALVNTGRGRERHRIENDVADVARSCIRLIDEYES
jgi:hypothetical protein